MGWVHRIMFQVLALEGWPSGEGRARVEMLGKPNSTDGNRGWLTPPRTTKARVRVHGTTSNFV
ncbi:mCG1042852 [Mus musculus]|nr:mCG1042852 [Mus musculus]